MIQVRDAIRAFLRIYYDEDFFSVEVSATELPYIQVKVQEQVIMDNLEEAIVEFLKEHQLPKVYIDVEQLI